MTIDKERVRRQFDRFADQYDEHAHVQTLMADRLLALAAQQPGENMEDRERLLEIGCGTGRLTQRLRQLYAGGELTALDISASMLVEAGQKPGMEDVRFVLADAEPWLEQQLHGRQRYSLIVSNAAFQWMSDPASVVSHCAQLLHPGGRLLFATFAPLTFQELHQSFAAAERRLGLPPRAHGLRFLSGDDWQHIFRSASAGKFVWEQAEVEQSFPSVREFMHSVKRIGAGNAAQSEGGADHLGVRKLFTEMERHYAAHFGVPGGIKATYHLGYGMYVKRSE